MAYMNSMVSGAKLAFMVGITLAVVNGLTQRFTPSHRTLKAIVSEQLTKVGA